ncbi:MAG TPA: DMSO/selenate family reductase complex B subunit [Chloroflexota bacterium]
MAKQLAFQIDTAACIGCKNCQVACQDKNDLPAGLRWRRITEYGDVSWVQQGKFNVPSHYFAYYISTSCNHCEKPACVEVCPTGAMNKGANGVVSIDSTKCIGCRYCEWACPYGAPQYDERVGRMTKCDFCSDLLAKGENPVCVDTCGMRAIKFGELEELRAQFGTVNAIEPMPSADITKPSLVLTPHRHAQPSGKGTGKILNPEVM